MAEGGVKKYLEEHYLDVYFEDGIAQMLSHRDEENKTPIQQNRTEQPAIKSSALKPVKFLKEYFTSVYEGTHVLFREFDFVSATPYNRLCVLKALMQIYKPLLYRQAYSLDARGYHGLVKLVFPDFPFEPIKDAVAACDEDKKDAENRLKFIDFIRAMKDLFCTGGFDAEATIIYYQLEDIIDHFINKAESGETSRKLTEEDFFNWQDDIEFSKWSAQRKIVDGSELKRILNIEDSSDEPVSGEKLSPKSSMELNNPSTSEKPEGEKKIKDRYEHILNRLNVLLSEKDPIAANNAKKSQRRPRSKSAAAALRKPWRP